MRWPWILAGLVVLGGTGTALFFLRAERQIQEDPAPAPREPAPSFTTRRTEFKSGTLDLRGAFYLPKQNAARPGIVLAHGRSIFGCNQTLYVVLCQKLAARGYTVLAFDFRGFGRSSDPPKVDTPDDLDFLGDLRQAVGHLLSQPGVDREHLYLVGHSFGAGVAIRYSLDDPRVRKVVAISPPRRSLELHLGEDAKNEEALEDMIEYAMRLPKGLPREILYPVMRELVPDVLLDHPDHVPVLFVEGAQERPEDRQFLKDLYQKIKGPKEYVAIEGAEHFYGTRRLWRGPRPADQFRESIVEDLAASIDGWLMTP